MPQKLILKSTHTAGIMVNIHLSKAGLQNFCEKYRYISTPQPFFDMGGNGKQNVVEEERVGGKS